ncbi:MAG TPA: hypothetical protein VFJ57_16235 [Solirubrobacterales bacterium]|nr:hypothetical protein [Solirubrobacterales bacterium]
MPAARSRSAPTCPTRSSARSRAATPSTRRWSPISPAAARKAASRARKRVDAEPTAPDVDLGRQRQVVEAFFEASREGDFDALVAVLDPQVVLRADGGEARPSANHVIRGAVEVARQAMTFARLSSHVQPVLVNGVAGVLVAPEGKPFSVMAFTVAGGKVVAIDALADPARLERLELGTS